MFRRLWEKIKLLWKLAKSERASPREIGWAVAIGAFAGCTPAVGVHGPLALGLASLFKKNRLFAWLDIDRDHALKRAGELILDWCLGTIPVGLVLGALMGAMAWAIAHRRDRRRKKRESQTESEGESETLIERSDTDTGTDTATVGEQEDGDGAPPHAPATNASKSASSP